MNLPIYLRILLIALLSVTLLAGCSDDDDNDSSQESEAIEEQEENNTEEEEEEEEEVIEEDAFIELELDGSTEAAYLDLINGEVVTEDGDWHLSFSRTSVGHNTDVEIALGDAQDDYYDEGEAIINLLTNLLADEEVSSMYDLVSDEGLTFAADETALEIGDQYYNYDFMSHAVTANTENYWLMVSSSGDSYAKVQATTIVQDGFEFTTTFTFDVQDSDESEFTADDATFTISNQAAITCFDFDADTTVDCSSDDWDLQMDGGDIKLNGGVSGSGSAAAYGPIDSTAIDAITDGSSVHSAAFTSDVLAGTFAENSWYAYNLLGYHGIWPNYRVYVIDTDSTDDANTLYKIQLVNYYNNDGDSGYVTVRFMELTDNGE